MRNFTEEVTKLIGTDAASAIGKARVNEIAFWVAQERSIATHNCEAKLAAERTKLFEERREYSLLQGSLDSVKENWSAQKQRAEKAEAENAALREQLAEAVRHHCDLASPSGDPVEDLCVQIESERAQKESLRGRVRVLTEALTEVLEVADLRGDSTLPHPCDDPKTWTARMQTAWDELRTALAAAPEPPASSLLDAWTREHHARHDHQYSGAYVAEWLRKQHAPEPPADPVADAVRKCAEIADDSMFGYEANEVIRAAYPQYFADPPATCKDDLQVREVQLAGALANEISGFRENKPAQIAGNPEPPASAGKEE